MHSDLTYSRLGLIALIGVACTAGSAQARWPGAAGPGNGAQNGLRDQQVSIPTAHGVKTFFVADPNATESDASLAASASAVAAGQAPTIPGFHIKARVLVRAANRAPLDAAALAGAGPGAAVAPMDPSGVALRNFWRISAPSINQAVTIAQALRADPNVGEAYVDIQQPIVLRTMPTDPGVPQQWHLKNSVDPSASIHVEPAWDAGFVGSGITIGINEFGWDITHPDLVNQYNAAASQPDQGYTSHGNATAGLAAAQAYNGIGGVGVAYGARVSRQYIGSASDIADSMTFRDDLNAIKSNSWGPNDSGNIWTISPLELQSFADAVNLGRGGLGTVIVWAAGNGGQNNDRANYDPYASSRYAIAIGAIDNSDRSSIYNEPGCSTLVVATSSYDFLGSDGSGIFSCSNTPTYTSGFGGTSAASPIAAGVVALMLQANPTLTWRDIAHILVRSARHVNPGDPDWTINGAGRFYHEQFAFGAIDASAAVPMAQTWTPVPSAVETTYPVVQVGIDIPDNDPVGVSSSFTVYPNMKLERVQVVLNAPHTLLGDLRIQLIGPTGTVSLFATPRVDFADGYFDYTFTSVKHWDENPRGQWTLKISDEEPNEFGSFDNWQLRLIGAQRKCPADWNYSGTVTIQDIFDFLGSWYLGQADFNNDGVSTVQDLFEFLANWFAPHPGGCS